MDVDRYNISIDDTQDNDDIKVPKYDVEIMKDAFVDIAHIQQTRCSLIDWWPKVAENVKMAMYGPLETKKTAIN